MSEAPAFSVVGEGAQQAEGGAVIDEGDVRLPGELHQGVLPVGEALGEVFVGHELHPEDAAGFKVFFAQGGVAFVAGAFVEVSVDVDEALGEGLLVVRVGVDDAVGLGCLGRRIRDAAKKASTNRTNSPARLERRCPSSWNFIGHREEARICVPTSRTSSARQRRTRARVEPCTGQSCRRGR